MDLPSRVAILMLWRRKPVKTRSAVSSDQLIRGMLALSLALLLLLGCRGKPEESPLDGTAWTLVALNGDAPIGNTNITLSFSGGFVNGFAGCNAYRSLIVGSDEDKYKYTATEEGALTIPEFVITEKDCPSPEGVMQQEQAYVEALRDAATYRITADRLEIDNAAGETTLILIRAKR
jgi:heat shock protein HslJ